MVLIISFEMDSEPITNKDIKGFSKLIFNVLDKVSTMEKNLYGRLNILKAKSLNFKQQKQAHTKKVNQPEEEVSKRRKAYLNLYIDSERKSKEDPKKPILRQLCKLPSF